MALKEWTGQTVSEYLAQNPNKASYTICASGKQFLCRQEEANSLFGRQTIAHIKYRNKNENLPVLTVN